MSASSVITLGYGPSGSASRVLRLGYGATAVVVPPIRPLNLGGYYPRKPPEPQVMHAQVRVHGGGEVYVQVGEITEQIPRAEKLKQMLTAMAV